MDSTPFHVDPGKMLIVEYETPGVGPTQTAVVGCRYVPVARMTGPVVAMEIVFDPARPAPNAAYFCPRSRLQRLLLAPSIVHMVRPYAVP